MRLKQSMALIVSFAMLLLLVACSSRTAVTAEEFIASCEELGFELSEENAETLGISGITTYIYSSKDKSSCQFAEYSSEADARGLYADMVDNLSSSGGTVEKKVDSSTYNKYFVRSDSVFQAVVRINNTVVYGYDTSEEGNLEKLLEKLNYK